MPGNGPELVVTDIYSAGEDPIPGVTTETLVEAIRDTARIPLHVVGPIGSVAGEVAVDQIGFSNLDPAFLAARVEGRRYR
jgi:hypothetical protein